MNQATAAGLETMAERAPSDSVKILLVDDDADNLLALQAVLEPLKQEMMLARSGLEALKLCLDHDFAAILLDVRMPDMDGFDTAQLIRQRRRSKRTPILFLTAYRSDEQLFRGYHLGAVDFLFKPIVAEILQSKVSVFVELSRNEQLLRERAMELSRTEQKFRAVLEAAPDAMLITDAAGMIELANSRADILFGHSREALIGLDVRILIPDWEPPQPGVESVHLKAVRRDGTVFPADVTASLVNTPEPVRFTMAVRDATDRVLAQELAEKTNFELEKRVQERTSALTFSNNALRQFAWAASHDLEEPARTVLAYSEWLAEAAAGRLDGRSGQMLDIIRQHSTHLHRMLGALREYIRVSESGSQVRTMVDSGACARAAASNLQRLIDESGATIHYGALPNVCSLEILLVQLFQNLIGNALKYRSEAPPEIRISAEPMAAGWKFSVADNGVGIDPQYFEYIFGVFRRLSVGPNSGAGIGLAICKAAVERLGGHIWVESRLGKGSVFHVYLPNGSCSEEATDAA